VRVLVAVEPLMYREAIAHILLQGRPQVEVRTAGPEDLAQEVESFLPHLVVCNVLSEKIKGTASSWVQILYEDSLDANVHVDALTPAGSTI